VPLLFLCENRITPAWVIVSRLFVDLHQRATWLVELALQRNPFISGEAVNSVEMSGVFNSSPVKSMYLIEWKVVPLCTNGVIIVSAKLLIPDS
jgi:hypothetical protein